jgi:hypothetical protein
MGCTEFSGGTDQNGAMSHVTLHRQLAAVSIRQRQDEAIKTEATKTGINLGVAKNVSLSTLGDKAHELMRH